MSQLLTFFRFSLKECGIYLYLRKEVFLGQPLKEYSAVWGEITQSEAKGTLYDSLVHIFISSFLLQYFGINFPLRACTSIS